MQRHLMCALLIFMLPIVVGADAMIVSQDTAGIPTFLSSPEGDLGFLTPSMDFNPVTKSANSELFSLSAKTFLQELAIGHFSATGLEEFMVSRVRTDDLGLVHVRFQQYLHGLKVIGAEMIVHAERESGKVYAVNGRFAPAIDVAIPTKGSDATIITSNLASLGVLGQPVAQPELLYFHDSATGRTHLSWKIQVQGIDNGLFFDNDVYVDAITLETVGVDANVHTAKVRRTYDATGSQVTNFSITGVPGTLVCSDSQSCPDGSSQRAHTGAGDVYDYYQTRFGRDSLNNSGMTLTSSVHVGSNWPNAAWYNNQMIYGDGDGTTLADLTLSFDVIAHELTHGVTDFESNLIYEKESGALNEALSDIFGVAADSYKRGVIDSATWKLGEEVYTPGTSGDALRYMNNPTLDGYSKDYYPERLYSGSCTPSSSNDQCGVHGNSGIANLAFQLLVEGGTHPRSKTTVNVPAIGMTKAEQIFYRAQTTYLTSSSNFQAIRTATTQAAQDLYGTTEVNAVHDAWCAVGVPGCPAPGGGSLQNGVAETGISGSTGGQTFYTIEIPAGATNLSIQMSGGSGDADLYVRFGSQPSTSTYDCRSWASGNTESCSFSSPSTGTYHVLVNAYSTFSGASLVATWDEPSASCDSSGSATNISGSQGSENRYTWNVPSCASKVTIKISGGSGDADLYVRFGSQPTTSTYDCRPWLSGNNETCTFNSPSTGTYHIMLYGYSSYSGVDLEASYE